MTQYICRYVVIFLMTFFPSKEKKNWNLFVFFVYVIFLWLMDALAFFPPRWYTYQSSKSNSSNKSVIYKKKSQKKWTSPTYINVSNKIRSENKITLLLPFKNKTFFWKLHFKIKPKTENKRDRKRSKEREKGGL